MVEKTKPESITQYINVISAASSLSRLKRELFTFYLGYGIGTKQWESDWSEAS
jgi:hypothetical protein